MKTGKTLRHPCVVSAVIFVLFAASALLTAACASQANSARIEFKPDPEWLDRRISIDERREFTVNGKRIWMSGANTPWNKWNDFGGPAGSWMAYNDKWWDDEFANLRKAGLNCTRVWINCNNTNNAVLITDNGMINGVSEQHWIDLDLFFETARRNRIYIMATLLSFDHFKNDGSRPEAEKWRAMLLTEGAAESFAENYTVPFVRRYGDNPWLWSIDLCNEPDWIFEDEECGQIPWENISYFMAVNAAAIHENSEVLVTVGMSSPKYNSDGLRSVNVVSDKYLQNLYPNENAYLDFWATHYYDWVGMWAGVPFYVRPNRFGMDLTKPSVIAECPARGSRGQTAGTQNNTIITDYENAYINSWQGVMPWTSNGVDSNGSLSDLRRGTLHMLNNYRDLIYPWD